MAESNDNNKHTLDFLLKCALCNEDLPLLLANNQPKSFPCLHTFCNPCLTNERQRFVQDTNIFKCPVCHTIVNQSSEDPEITNNLKLDVIIEKLLHVRHLQQSKCHYCEMCPEKGIVVSTHWCQDCGKFLCDRCLVQHEYYKPNDKVIAVSEGVVSEKVGDFILPTKCSDHKENFKMYCLHCELCLCSACSLEHRSDENADCGLVFIETVTPQKKSEGQILLKKTYSHLEKEKTQIEGMKVKIGDLKIQCSEKGGEIWDHVEETVRRLKENGRVLIAELEAKTRSEIDELENLIQIRQNHVKEMEITDNTFRQLLHSFDNVDILLNYDRLTSKCENLLREPNNDVPSTSHEVNIAYHFWYLKTHEMSKNVPLGSCSKKGSKLAEPSVSDEKGLNTKPEASNVPLGILLPPVPYLGNSIGEFTDDKCEDVYCILVTEENNVLVGSYGTLYEYNKANELCGIHKPKGMGYCSGLCRFSSDKICVVDGNLILLQMNKKAPFLTFFKCLNPDVEYYSICNCYGKILVCDFNCCVHLLNEEDGTVRRTVLNIKRRPSGRHKIRCGPFEDTFLLLHDEGQDWTLFCYSLDGCTCLFSLKPGLPDEFSQKRTCELRKRTKKRTFSENKDKKGHYI